MSNEHNDDRLPEDTPEPNDDAQKASSAGNLPDDDEKQDAAPQSKAKPEVFTPPSGESCQAGKCDFGRALVLLCLLASLGFNAYLAYQLRTERLIKNEQISRIWLKDQRDVLLVPEPTTKAVTSAHFQARDLDQQMLERTAELFRLSSIHLGETNITDEQLKYLSGLSYLASLVLSDTNVSDEGLPYLNSLGSLEVLHLPGTKITNEGLKTIAALPNLKVLDVSRTAVDNEGLKHLQRATKLEWLLLSDTDITDEGLKHLTPMKQLKRLTLNNTSVTKDGESALRKANPNLAIDHLMDKKPEPKDAPADDSAEKPEDKAAADSKATDEQPADKPKE